jgi:hypothetical protein
MPMCALNILTTVRVNGSSLLLSSGLERLRRSCVRQGKKSDARSLFLEALEPLFQLVHNCLYGLKLDSIIPKIWHNSILILSFRCPG